MRPDTGSRVTPKAVAALFHACISPATGAPQFPLATLNRRSVIPGDVTWEHPSKLLLSFTPHRCATTLYADPAPGAPSMRPCGDCLSNR